MGIFDKAKKLVGKNKEQIKGGVDKAADLVEKKTPDKYDAKVDDAAETVKGLIDKTD